MNTPGTFAETAEREDTVSSELSEGCAAVAHFGGGVVEGRVVEVRREAPGVTRVVIRPFGGGVEVDTDASRVEIKSRARFCPSCDAEWETRPTYRCPECGADLVRG